MFKRNQDLSFPGQVQIEAFGWTLWLGMRGEWSKDWGRHVDFTVQPDGDVVLTHDLALGPLGMLVWTQRVPADFYDVQVSEDGRW